MSDPETGEVWVTLDTGADVAFPADGMVRVVRKRQAPEWIRKCASEYRDARIAWERDRENVACGYATEMREYGESVRAPRYADFVRQAAAAMRQPA